MKLIKKLLFGFSILFVSRELNSIPHQLPAMNSPVVQDIMQKVAQRCPEFSLGLLYGIFSECFGIGITNCDESMMFLHAIGTPMIYLGCKHKITFTLGMFSSMFMIYQLAKKFKAKEQKSLS